MENKNCTNPININQATPGKLSDDPIQIARRPQENCKLTPIGVVTHSFGTAAIDGSSHSNEKSKKFNKNCKIVIVDGDS